MSDEATLGSFEEQIVLAVIHAAAEAFGMNVRREIATRTGRDVAIGAVYATLDRLEAKRLVASTRSRASGSSRRLFHVTAAGVRALTGTREIRDRLWRGIDLTRSVASAAG